MTCTTCNKNVRDYGILPVKNIICRDCVNNLPKISILPGNYQYICSNLELDNGRNHNLGLPDFN